MYIHSVKLINFKSIGNYAESEIIVEPRITAIIGRNESGKSNILEGLSQINFMKKNMNAFVQENVNRSAGLEAENKYIIILKANQRDNEIGIYEDTIIEITPINYKVTGGFLLYYQKTIYDEIQELVNELKSIGTNPFVVRDQDWNNYRNYISGMERKEYLNIYTLNNAFLFFLNKANNLPADKKNDIVLLVKKIKSKWEAALTLFPKIFYRKSNKHLRTSYKIDEIEKELASQTDNKSSLLNDFVKLIGISVEEFILAAKTGSQPQQGTIRRKINRLIDEKINKKFENYYTTEKIILDMEFNGGVISFMVRSGEGEALAFSERSNGLRWYLELFIEAHANNVSEHNVIYLLDEPGISLHVNAQTELLKLFEYLAEKGNQIVYTTHSPYMLNLEQEGLHRIRAVIKKNDGNTKIYKTAYDARIAPDAQEDTLAPIVAALGMSLQNTIGPALGKKNIVTEGISDYIYFCLMAKVLNVEMNEFIIIPSVGVTNSINICEILQGWKCDFMAVFDYDNEGVEKGGEYMRKELFYECGRQFYYLKDVTQEEVERHTYKSSPFRIEELVTENEIDRFCNEAKVSKTTSKTLIAKLMSSAVEMGEYEMGEECCNNFKEFFARLGLVKNILG